MRPNIARTVLGGFIATAIMTMLMFKMPPMMGMKPMDPGAMLGQFFGGSWWAGMIEHFLNGSLFFPLIYALLLYRVLPGHPVAKGAIWGMVLWFLSQAAFAPLVGGGFFSSQAGGMMAVVGSLINHLIYGGVLGWIAGPARVPATREQAPSARAA
jgi:hypothetical protein